MQFEWKIISYSNHKLVPHLPVFLNCDHIPFLWKYLPLINFVLPPTHQLCYIYSVPLVLVFYFLELKPFNNFFSLFDNTKWLNFCIFFYFHFFFLIPIALWFHFGLQHFIPFVMGSKVLCCTHIPFISILFVFFSLVQHSRVHVLSVWRFIFSSFVHSICKSSSVRKYYFFFNLILLPFSV